MLTGPPFVILRKAEPNHRAALRADQIFTGDANGPAEAGGLSHHLVERVHGFGPANSRDRLHFFPALEDLEAGLRITNGWSATARRLNDQFEVSVAFVNGKRCLGGMLELMMHCHFLVAVEDAQLGWPEATLPVVPGMEGCHWPFRRAPQEQWPRLLRMLLTGESVRARDAVGWLADAAAPLPEALATAYGLATGAATTPARRELRAGVLDGVPTEASGIADPETEGIATARRTIVQSLTESARVPIAQALEIQARIAAEFLASDACRQGRVGAEAARVLQ